MKSLDEIKKAISEIPDPEIPVISIKELGVLRNIFYDKDRLKVVITPTYSGCPAIKTFMDDIKNCLKENSIYNIQLKLVYSPAWTTDWMTEKTKLKLKEYGISPPSDTVVCPQCNSTKTNLISEFGATACKSLYKCIECLEPFEHFKCI